LASRVFNLAGQCGIPTYAKAVTANVTITGANQTGYLRAFAADTSLPLISVINFLSGQTRANNAIIPVSRDGNAGIIFRCDMPAGTVQLIVDLTGYFK
jgi:hypothetical protein